MRLRLTVVAALLAVFGATCALHAPFLRLPYFWDEAGYYIPSALDFYRRGLLIPQSTLPTGHTPLVAVYLALAWRAFGFSTLATRAAMSLMAAATLVSLYALARQVFPGQDGREMALWSCLLLALSPLFFAQSTLAHLDLAVALFTTLAVLALLRGRLAMFAGAATLAILSKETAVVLLPVAALLLWRRARDRPPGSRRPDRPFRFGEWLALACPALLLAAWALYYHHSTGYWTGNAGYLQYNLYSTLSPVRILLSLARRLYETVIGGFNWLLAAGAVAGWRYARKGEMGKRKDGETALHFPFSHFPVAPLFRLTAELSAAYILMLSVVGGAILPRYLLPIFPLLYLLAVALVWLLPRLQARLVLLAAAVCFVSAWFINPPYPFPYEDNLAYADFIHLHRQAAQFLESDGSRLRIATAWPASDELAKPALGYVAQPLPVEPMNGFTSDDLARLQPDSFDLIYLYSREWNPPANWLRRFPRLLDLQKRYFAYAPQLPDSPFVDRFHLRLIAHFERRGQWVRIYARAP